MSTSIFTNKTMELFAVFVFRLEVKNLLGYGF